MFTRSPARFPCEYAPLRKGTDPTGRRTPRRCRCEARRSTDSRFAVKRRARNDVHGAQGLFDDTSDLKRGHIPPDIRLRSEPMDPDNSFGHGLPLTASSRSASGKQRKLVCELTARWRLLGVLCRRRVHDTARAVAVHVNRVPSIEYMCATMCYGHGPTRATEYRKVPLCATTELHVTECHCATPRVPPDAAERRRASWSFVAEATECHRSPPSAHTAASNALYSAWHRVALGPPSNTKCQPLY